MEKLKSLVLFLIVCIFLIGLTEAGKTSGYKCAPSLTNCFGNCVDLKSDSDNCGTCGMSCPSGFVCDKRRCVCPSGETACNGECVDLQSDPDNCAVCGLTCTGGKVCSGGVCVCPEGTVECSGMCLDVTSDVNNCGTCGKECSAPYNGAPTCSNGACDFACDPGYTKCGLGCVDTSSDANNCGGCGIVCPSGVCIDGMCDTTSPVVLSVDIISTCPDIVVTAHVADDVGVVSVKSDDIYMSLIEGDNKDGIWRCVIDWDSGWGCLAPTITATDGAGNAGSFSSDGICWICVIPDP
jgi:hypothetical protein